MLTSTGGSKEALFENPKAALPHIKIIKRMKKNQTSSTPEMLKKLLSRHNFCKRANRNVSNFYTSTATTESAETPNVDKRKKKAS